MLFTCVCEKLRFSNIPWEAYGLCVYNTLTCVPVRSARDLVTNNSAIDVTYFPFSPLVLEMDLVSSNIPILIAVITINT